MTEAASERIAKMTGRNPQAVELARLLSFALLIEPALLRAVRLRLLSQTDTGTEADLWFGPLVQSRSRDGIMLYPDVAELLRSGMSDQQAAQCWQLTTSLHEYLPPTVKIEEELNWLSSRRAETDAARHKLQTDMRELLQRALSALLARGEAGIANWAGRALPRLPATVQQLDETAMLSAASDLRLGRVLTIAGLFPNEKIPAWFAGILPDDFPETTLSVELGPTGLIFNSEASEQALRIDVPATEPRVVQLSQAHRSQIVSVGLSGSVAVSFSFNDGPAELTTLAGRAYMLTPQARTGPAASGFVCRAYANCNQALIAWQSTRLIETCLGFALERIGPSGDSVPLANFVGFGGAKERTPQPSTVWPMQRFWWTDLAAPQGGRFSYRVTPVVGPPGKLRLATEASYDTGQVEIAPSEHSEMTALFNREFRTDERPTSAHSAVSARPASVIRQKLKAFLAEAREARRAIYASTWWLDDAEIIEALAAVGGAHVTVSTDEPSRANAGPLASLAGQTDFRLRQVSDRAEPFLVMTDSDARPSQVWTGSAAWTSAELDAPDSHALLIRSPAIAQFYLERWHQQRSPDTALQSPMSRSFTLQNGSRATVWFGLSDNTPWGEDYQRQLANSRSGLLFAFETARLSYNVNELISRLGRYVAGVTFEPGYGVTVYHNGTTEVLPDQAQGDTAAPLGSRMIVIDPFDSSPTVMMGSQVLGATTVQPNERDLVTIEGDSELAAQCAVHIRGLMDHFLGRARAAASRRPASSMTLEATDKWQNRFLRPDLAREVAFWVGNTRTVYSDPEGSAQAPPASRSPAKKSARKTRARTKTIKLDKRARKASRAPAKKSAKKAAKKAAKKTRRPRPAKKK